MNWDMLRFDWVRARAFLATAETGSLSAAARVLKLAQPTVGRQVEALERELDVTLFERIGKRLVVTPPGSTCWSTCAPWERRRSAWR
jgi:DNA-binding transcriptional LysR family regulator